MRVRLVSPTSQINVGVILAQRGKVTCPGTQALQSGGGCVFRPQLCHLLACCSWANCFSHLSLSFLI